MDQVYNPLNFPGGKDLVRTLSGLYIDVMNPTPAMFDITDIAHGLAFECRFGRQLADFYTVAQHSVTVAQLAPDNLKLAALLHDAAEFILGDLPAPVKRNIPEYKAIEVGIMEVLAAKFGFTWPLDPIIKEIDNLVLREEYRNLVTGPVDSFFTAWPPPMAEARFLQLYHELTSGLKSRG